MRNQTVIVSMVLLALWFLLIPGGGESAGGILALFHVGDQQRDESVNEPEGDQGLVQDLLRSNTKHKRDAEEAAQAGEWRKV